ncbi:MAG TPA: hypothetical protein VF384_09560 [Planctomycetota bacterium]
MALVLLALSCVPAATSAQCAYQWQPLGAGIGLAGSTVAAIATLPDGSIVAYSQGLLTNFVRWNGTTWATFATVDAGINSLVRLANNDLLAGGSFLTIGGVSANRIARWNGTAWSPLGSGIDQSIVSRIHAIVEMPNGDIVIGGWFTTAGGVSANKIARWNGTAWSALGSGMDSNVHALTALPNGDLIAGGNFTTAGGVPANAVARWNGSTWFPMGSGVNGVVSALATLPGNLVLAGGSFTAAGGSPASRIAQWNGAAWTPLGAGVAGGVNALLVRPAGDVIVGGGFVSAGGIAASLVARWTGTHWAPVGSGLDRAPLFGVENVASLGSTNAGDLVAGGNFTAAAGNPVNRIARFGAGCPSSVTSYGGTCSGAAGPLVLGFTSMPVVGNTYQMTATGFPGVSIGVRMIGSTSTAIPLPAVLPVGQVGCELSVDPNILFDLAIPAAGSVSLPVPLPNIAALISLVAYAQVGSIELSGSGAITSIVTSNGLGFTVGTY